MCGIAGFFGNGNIESMTKILSHRGPDDSGYFKDDKVQLGVRRLAIIDLATGHQPILNEDKSLVLIFNGEIFNYQELKRNLFSRGHIFTTKTDSEVVLHAYEEYGEQCLLELNGMFAFTIYDKSRHRLFMARDRLGEKPFYYTKTQDTFYFASEIKSILTQVDTVSDIDELFFAIESSFGEKTLFKDIFSLLPAHYMIYDGRNLQVTRYWDFPKEAISCKSERLLIDQLRCLIEDAVKIRLNSDVSLGVLLSGGLDSAIIACLARPEKVFSCHYAYGEKYDEIAYARLVAEHIGAEHVIVSPKKEDFKANLSKVLWHLDEPIATASPFSLFMVCEQIAKTDVKVLLSGEGADELFGGYVRYAMLLNDREKLNHPLFDNYNELFRYLESVEGDLANKYSAFLNRGDKKLNFLTKVIGDIFRTHNSSLNAMAVADFNFVFPSLLNMGDKITSAFGLESRSPFLDYRIVEFAFSLPDDLKIREFTSKYILREAVKGLIPEGVRTRIDKKGLVSPINQWLQSDLVNWKNDCLAKLPISYPIAKNKRGEFDRSDYTKLCLAIWINLFFK